MLLLVLFCSALERACCCAPSVRRRNPQELPFHSALWQPQCRAPSLKAPQGLQLRRRARCRCVHMLVLGAQPCSATPPCDRHVPVHAAVLPAL